MFYFKIKSSWILKKYKGVIIIIYLSIYRLEVYIETDIEI